MQEMIMIIEDVNCISLSKNNAIKSNWYNILATSKYNRMSNNNSCTSGLVLNISLAEKQAQIIVLKNLK